MQDSADLRGGLLDRPDGSFLAFDGVAVLEGTGEGEGNSILDFAAAGLTPSFAQDPSFGGPATPLYVKAAGHQAAGSCCATITRSGSRRRAATS